MKVAVVGDTHGSMFWMRNDVIPYAHKAGATKIVQVGDFGFIWPGPHQKQRLHNLNALLDAAGIELHFLPGNHENHTALAEYAANSETNPDGHHIITKRILYTGRHSTWQWEGRTFASVGGAVSIDRARRQREHQLHGTDPTWWPEEILSADELTTARDMGPVDVLFTHDAPNSYPLDGLIPDLESSAYRQAMSDIGHALTPKLWFHGHYHQHLIYQFHHTHGVSEVTALDCDGSSRLAGVAILDTEN